MTMNSVVIDVGLREIVGHCGAKSLGDRSEPPVGKSSRFCHVSEIRSLRRIGFWLQSRGEGRGLGQDGDSLCPIIFRNPIDGARVSQCFAARMAYWAVARTIPHREPVAARRLSAVGFEIFAPKTKAGPLFPGYLFVRIIEQWQAIDRTHGVLKLVKFGECPARCPDAEIAKLQAQVDPSNGLIRLPARPPDAIRRKISIGAKVRIAGLDAIYIGMTARQREWVLRHPPRPPGKSRRQFQDA